MALTDTWLKKNLGKEREDTLVESDQDGLSVRVSPKGKITFQMRFRYNGKQARLDFGSYPLLSLKDARAKLLKMKAVLEQGYDPRIHKKVEKVKIAEAITFKDLYETWHEKYCLREKKQAEEIHRTFELYVFPVFGALPVDSITLHAWLELLEAHLQKSESITERILVNTKQCLEWGIKRKLIENNPIRHISGKNDLGIKKRRGTRILTDEEIALTWCICDESRMTLKNALFIKLCLFFGCRNGELRTSEKTFFDLNKMIWSVPPELHKTGKNTGLPLIRPIIPEIVPLIEQAMSLNDSKFMFVNDGTTEMMSLKSPGSLPYNIMQYARRKYDINMPHWSIHDLRRTARTNFSAFTSRDVAELMVGHAMPGEQGTYDLYDYLEPQTKAYQLWWDKLKSLAM
ncbi:tyrosine-type recombinase/integrase [Acinetobacter pittii]|uniref:tyrosine-type recombinase/integrase n=1 Tax=Acinetobacter pittii TaxID=48296 RepID=UPI001D08CD5A|nr:site-specific integrase [Acinetobacter pittii]